MSFRVGGVGVRPDAVCSIACRILLGPSRRFSISRIIGWEGRPAGCVDLGDDNVAPIDREADSSSTSLCPG